MGNATTDEIWEECKKNFVNGFLVQYSGTSIFLWNIRPIVSQFIIVIIILIIIIIILKLFSP